MNSINTPLFLRMLEKGSKNIADNFGYINDLNVFPVPDGDTGTNMMLTVGNSYDELSDKKSLPLNDFAKLFSRTLLMNARGNSGVIFTQIFRGFFSTIISDPEKLTIEIADVITCFKTAKESAYSAVTNPVEGTMLTIVRVISEKLSSLNKVPNSIGELFSYIVEVGNKTVQETTEMLPQLKEANVIDSGAYGLMLFIEGMFEVLNNASSNAKEFQKEIKEELKIKAKKGTKRITYIDNLQRQEISEEGFGYCCEFICQIDYQLFADQDKKNKLIPESFEKELLRIGDSLVKIIDDNLIKVHIHTFWPYKLLEIGQKYGEFLKVKIENMTQQYLDNNPDQTAEEIFNKNKLTNKTRILITVPSNKLGKFFKKEFAVYDYIDTDSIGNPSIIHFTNKIHDLKAKNIIVIIDDVNIFMAAEQAVKLQTRSNIVLVRATNPMQVLSALFVFDADLDVFKNKKIMDRAIENSRTGAISISSKSLKTNGITIYKGDNIAIINKNIIYADIDVIEVVKKLIKKLSAWRKSDTINIIYGKDVSMNHIAIIEKHINENLNMKCKFIDGKQSIYNYYIGI